MGTEVELSALPLFLCTGGLRRVREEASLRQRVLREGAQLQAESK